MSFSVHAIRRVPGFLLRARFASEGGVMALFGPSGCGKSMALRCVAGIDRPDGGRVVLNGRVLYDAAARVCLPPQRRGVGYLFQNSALFPHMTVRQNVLAALHGKCGRAEARRRASDALELLRLADVAELRPHQLSGGQAQRAALARILAAPPKLLMLDEPFSALDEPLRRAMADELGELLGGFHSDAILVTHDREEAFRLSQRAALMDGGRIVEQGDTQALFRRPRTLASARLLGVENVSRARRIDAHRALALDWGWLLTLPDAPEGMTHVGVRAASLRPAAEEDVNRTAARLARCAPGLTSARQWMALPNGALLEWQTGAPSDATALAVSPEDVLALTQAAREEEGADGMNMAEGMEQR